MTQPNAETTRSDSVIALVAGVATSVSGGLALGVASYGTAHQIVSRPAAALVLLCAAAIVGLVRLLLNSRLHRHGRSSSLTIGLACGLALAAPYVWAVPVIP